MEGIQRWIVSLTAMAMLTGIFRSLMPEGSARRVGGLVCALMLFLVLAAPVTRMRLDRLGQSLGDWAQQYEGYSGALEETDRALQRSLIEEQCQAYLEDRARALGSPCTAAVECRERDGVDVPGLVTFTGALSGEQRSALRSMVVSELGLEPEQIRFSEEEQPS